MKALVTFLKVNRCIYIYICVCVCVCVCIYTHVYKYISHSVMSDPMDCSLPGSSVHGILQERLLEWVGFPAISCILCTFAS